LADAEKKSFRSRFASAGTPDDSERQPVPADAAKLGSVGGHRIIRKSFPIIGLWLKLRG
jgi:hypothetical protein